jgi:hypothetical protein
MTPASTRPPCSQFDGGIVRDSPHVDIRTRFSTLSCIVSLRRYPLGPSLPLETCPVVPMGGGAPEGQWAVVRNPIPEQLETRWLDGRVGASLDGDQVPYTPLIFTGVVVGTV